MPGQQDLIHGQESVSRIRRRTSGDRQPATTATHPLVNLQRKIGNAQVARMLAQRAPAPGEEDEAAGQVALTRDPALQRAAPESEEDETDGEMSLKRDPALQRAAAEGEEDETDGEMSLKRDPSVDREAAPEVGMAGGPISSGLSSRIESKRGSGSSLDSSTQQSMEAGFGASFADVRVHTDSESDTLNRSVGAKAFTVGSDIFFSRNASPSDSQLLAHELTHVTQQAGSGGSSGPLTVTAANDAGEAEADSMASSVTSGAAAAVQAQRHAAEESDR